MKNLCIAGGVGLNSVANGKLYDETPFKNIFVQPAATDAGGALGVAMYVYHQILGNKRNFKMDHVYLGPSFTDKEIEDFLKNEGVKYEKLSKKKLTEKVARLLYKNKVIGWFQGRMEWGPRALGNRSILANPINPGMKEIVNKKVKHREPFRPFAGSILLEDVNKFFDMPYKNHETPFMVFVFNINEEKRKSIPSISHVDGTCRPQTVKKQTNKLFYNLIKEFKRITDIPIILNTSFNVKGEPIVCTPQDALNDFKNTYMDYLVINKFLIKK